MPSIWDALLGNIPRQPGAPGYAYPPSQVPNIWDLFGMGQTGDNPWVPPATPAMGAPTAWQGAGPPAPVGTSLRDLIAGLFSGGAGATPGVGDLVPNFGTMAKGLGAMATMPSQQTDRIPAVPIPETGPLVSEAARAVLPERSPLMSMLTPRAPDPTPIPPTAAESQFKWPAAPTGGPTSITIPGRGGVAAPAGGVGTPGAPSAVDPVAAYMPKMYGAESGDKMIGNRAGASSAFGPAQFTKGTWLDTVKTADRETWNALGGDEAKVLALRSDPTYHKTMAEAFTRQNAEILTQKGLPVNDGTLYAMHFFGQAGGPKVLQASPDTPIEKLVTPEAIAANPHLKGMNAGQAKAWAESTIGAKTGTGNAFGLPNAPVTSAPQLPTPPTLQAMKGIDPAVYDQFLKQRAMMAPPMTMADRVTNLLGRGAAAVVGQKTAGDVLAAFGGGVGQGASENLARERGELQQGADRSQDLLKQFAGVGVKKEEAKVEGQNLQTDAANKNAALLNQVKTEQAKLDAAAKNANVGAQFQLDLKAFEMGQPQITFGKDGDTVHIATRQPDGGYKIDQMSLNTSVHELKKKVDDVKGVLGDKGTPLVSMYEDAAITKLANGSPELAKTLAVGKVVRDAIQEGMLSKIMPAEAAQKLEKEAEKGLDIKTLGNDAKGYKAQKDAALFNLIMRDRSLKPADFEKVFLGGMAKFGNTTAQRLQGGGR